jgi:polyisoprenoid-binding protein YceI
MNRRTLLIVILVLIAFGLGAGAGALGLLWATGGLETESAAIADVAPTLSLDGPTPTPSDALRLATQIAQINTRLDGIEGSIAALGQGIASAGTAAAIPTATPTPAAGASSDAPARGVFRINQDESQVRFLIDEILGGSPSTVIAATRRVAGDLIVDFANPPGSQVGEIAINARTFRTDQEFRDDSIRGHILETDTHEFIRFVPAAINGLPGAPVSVGDTVAFQIVGDLTVKAVTRSVTFEASIIIEDADRISGLARAEALYTDFDITINTPPLVSDVAESLIMEIEFVALRVE